MKKACRVSRYIMAYLFILVSLLSVRVSAMPGTAPASPEGISSTISQSAAASQPNLPGKADGPGAVYVNTVCVELHALIYNELFLGGKPDTHAGMYIDWETESLTIALTDLQAVDSYRHVINRQIDNIVKSAFASADPIIAAQYSTHEFVQFIQQPYSLNYLNRIKRSLSQKMDTLSLSCVSVDQENNCVEAVVEASQRDVLNRHLVEAYGLDEETMTNTSSFSHPPIQISEGAVAIQPTAINAYSGNAISNDFGYYATIGFNATDRITGQKGIVASYHLAGEGFA